MAVKCLTSTGTVTAAEISSFLTAVGRMVGSRVGTIS